MSNITTNQGIQQGLSRAFAINGPPAKLQSVGVDDGTGALAAGTTTFNGTNVEANLFEIAPTRSSQTSTAQGLFGTAEANFVHKRIGLFNTGASTTSPLTGLYGGIDSLSSVGITKDSTFSVRHIINQTFVNIGTGNNLVVNQGLQLIIDNLYDIAPLNASKILSMGFDDGASAYTAGNTTFTGATAAISVVFDATPTNSTNVYTAICTIPLGGAGNNMNGKTITRVNLNTQTATVSQTAGAISGLVAGVSNRSVFKEVDYTLKFTLTMTGSSA